jgi:hypothetical protein
MSVALRKFGPFQGAWVFGWDLASGEVGLPALVAPWGDKTVQVYGTFATGNVQLEGAIHGGELDLTTPTYTILRDLPGQAISGKTALYCETIQQHVTHIRPVATTITAVSIRIICTAARMRTA